MKLGGLLTKRRKSTERRSAGRCRALVTGRRRRTMSTDDVLWSETVSGLARRSLSSVHKPGAELHVRVKSLEQSTSSSLTGCDRTVPSSTEDGLLSGSSKAHSTVDSIVGPLHLRSVSLDVVQLSAFVDICVAAGRLLDVDVLGLSAEEVAEGRHSPSTGVCPRHAVIATGRTYWPAGTAIVLVMEVTVVEVGGGM